MKGNLYGSELAMGEFHATLHTKRIQPIKLIPKSETFEFKDVQFVEGNFLFRLGKWITDKHWYFKIQGVYSEKTGKLYIYAIPPSWIQS